jgi:predicted ferric reductase
MRRWRTAVRQQFALARCLDPADGQGFYRRDPTATTVTQQRGARPLRAVRRGAPFRPAPPRVRRLWIVGDVVGAMTIASIVVVIVLWLVHGNVRDFGTDGGTITALGRLTGLLAADLLLIQVLLMARIPWVEQVWGQDELTRRHRLVGFSSFWLMCIHIVLITVGYAQSSHTDLLAQGWDLLTNYPGLLLAAAGTLALLVVVVTSVRAARTRLRYTSWHLIHLYAYLGVGLALPHQLWTGQDFLASTLATAYWWGLWAAAAAAIVCFRIVMPIVGSVRHRLVVSEIVPEADGIFSIVMKGRDLHVSGMRAGQFCQWRFLTGRGWSRPQPFSLSSPPTTTTLRITVQQVGEGTDRLSGIRPGTKVHFEGPYGTMTADRRRRRDVLLIGAGVGITPMLGLAQEISREQGPGRRPSVVVLHRVHDVGGAPFVADFDSLNRRKNVQVVRLIGPRGPDSGWFPGPGRVDPVAALTALVPDVADREVYVCGPKPWAAAVRVTLHSCGLPRRAVHVEDFAT